ncbi:MAG: hypothetical protein HN995_09535 [Candidatus Marinimicrobia bacterium]|jgi:hypothetical protein|nr:hypothetical protein [Candidatus Neomarinimicrobiota bacterium]MBT3680287.1 hypothetical protein [Candidatus Neomarinimicrobiota bacterium]MBT4252500.1 hypothetical protein [Candidatus Neomarinimicrobiota bacterium]MBT4481530.1 hypothetical protein [Candidatus Neomarinimicrobiota bacterium]MBT5235029.1 hypothetical protein [Candidatus Neomarinimicrobiota bacterium]
MAGQRSTKSRKHYFYIPSIISTEERSEYDCADETTKHAPDFIRVQENPPPDQRLNFRLGANGSALSIPSSRICQVVRDAGDVQLVINFVEIEFYDQQAKKPCESRK